MEKPTKNPRIGVGIYLISDGKVLLGERKGAHGEGTWAPPGGHLEFGESPAECAARELQEETGLVAKEILSGPWSNDIFESEGKHYITLCMLVTKFSGILENKEPHKCLGFEWFDLDSLPSPLFIPLANLQKEQGTLDLVFKNYIPETIV